jgi:hypothetical protein
VLHCAARLPSLTTLFSDQIAAQSLNVTQGGMTTVTAPGHGYSIGADQGLCIVDANVPNKIVSAHIQPTGDWLFETEFGHDLTFFGPESSLGNWNVLAHLTGFSDTQLNGLVQLVDVPSPTEFVVKPSSPVSSVVLNGNQALLERLENGIVGWHKMRVISASELEFTTPLDVIRSYTVTAPKIATNIRVFGALSLETARAMYNRGYRPNEDQQDAHAVQDAWLVITPPPSVALSKDRMASGDGVSEITPWSENRQLLLDGFHVYAFLPAEHSAGGIACSDLASGEVLQAVLRTFHGLVLPRRELAQADSFVSLMVEHGNALGDYDRATYIHGYIFQAPAYLTQFDAIQPFEWSRISETTMTASSGLGPGSPGGAIVTTIPPGQPGAGASLSVAPAGSVAFRGIELGIKHDDRPQPLIATVSLT